MLKLRPRLPLTTQKPDEAKVTKRFIQERKKSLSKEIDAFLLKEFNSYFQQNQSEEKVRQIGQNLFKLKSQLESESNCDRQTLDSIELRFLEMKHDFLKSKLTRRFESIMADKKQKPTLSSEPQESHLPMPSSAAPAHEWFNSEDKPFQALFAAPEPATIEHGFPLYPAPSTFFNAETDQNKQEQKLVADEKQPPSAIAQEIDAAQENRFDRKILSDRKTQIKSEINSVRTEKISENTKISFTQMLKLSQNCFSAHSDNAEQAIKIIENIQRLVNLKKITTENFKQNESIISDLSQKIKNTKAFAFLENENEQEIKDFLLHLVIAATHQNRIWSPFSKVGINFKTDTINKIIKKIRSCGRKILTNATDGSHIVFEAQDTWQNGNLIQGKKTYANGDVFEGTFGNGWLIQGKKTCANGDVFDGTWKNGNFIQGKKTCANGDVFEGTWGKEWFIQGKKTCARGDVVEGKWDKGNFVKGTTTYAGGEVLEGKWDKGYPVEGKITFKNGDVYELEFDEQTRNCIKLEYKIKETDPDELKHQNRYVESLKPNQFLSQKTETSIEWIVKEFFKNYGFNPNDLEADDSSDSLLDIFKTQIASQNWYNTAEEKEKKGIQNFIAEVQKKLKSQTESSEEIKKRNTTFMKLAMVLFSQVLHYLNMNDEEIPQENKKQALLDFADMQLECAESFPERMKGVLTKLTHKTKFSNPWAVQRDALIDAFTADFIALREKHGLHKLAGREIHYRAWIANLLPDTLNFHSSYESETDTYALLNQNNNETYLNHLQDHDGVRQPSTLTMEKVIDFFAEKIKQQYQDPSVRAEAAKWCARLYPFMLKEVLENSDIQKITEVFDDLAADGVVELSGLMEKYVVPTEPDDEDCATYKLNDQIFKDLPFLIGQRFVALGYFTETCQPTA